MKITLSRLAGDPRTAASILLAFAACACAAHEEAEDDAQEPLASQAPVDEVLRSVDLSHDENLPQLEGAEDLDLIEEVNLAGRRVGFYEAADGAVLHVERGRIDAVVRAPEEKSLTGSALYEFLTHKPAPDRLIESELRAGVTRQETPAKLTPVEPTSGRTKCGTQGGCPISNITNRDRFLETWCAPVNTGYTDGEWLWTWVTGDSWITRANAFYFSSAVLSNMGTLRYEARYGDPNNRNLSYKYFYMLLRTGYYIAWSRHEAPASPARSSVSEASGDIYDHCVNYSNAPRD